MMLTALLVFDKADLAAKAEKVSALMTLSQEVLDSAEAIQKMVSLDYNRVIYLGAGHFFGLAHEALLSILKFSAGLHAPSQRKDLLPDK